VDDDLLRYLGVMMLIIAAWVCGLFVYHAVTQWCAEKQRTAYVRARRKHMMQEVKRGYTFQD
jgi:transketolase C-terminal domain/subunit